PVLTFVNQVDRSLKSPASTLARPGSTSSDTLWSNVAGSQVTGSLSDCSSTMLSATETVDPGVQDRPSESEPRPPMTVEYPTAAVAPSMASARTLMTLPPTKQLRSVSSAPAWATMPPPRLVTIRLRSIHARPPSTSTPGTIDDALLDSCSPSSSTVASLTVSCGVLPPLRIHRGGSTPGPSSAATHSSIRPPSTVTGSL